MSAPPKFQRLAGNHLLHKWNAETQKRQDSKNLDFSETLKCGWDLNPTRFGHPGSTHALVGLRATSDNANLKQLEHSRKWYVCEASMEGESNAWGASSAQNRWKDANWRISWKFLLESKRRRTAKVLLNGTRRLECKPKDANDAMEACIIWSKVNSGGNLNEKRSANSSVKWWTQLRTEPPTSGSPWALKRMDSSNLPKPCNMPYPVPCPPAHCHREFQPINVWLGNLKLNQLRTQKQTSPPCLRTPSVSLEGIICSTPFAISFGYPWLSTRFQQVSDPNMQKASLWGMCASFRGAFRLSLCPYPYNPYDPYNPYRTSIGLSKLISHSTVTTDLAERSSITSDRFFNFHAFDILQVS